MTDQTKPKKFTDAIKDALAKKHAAAHPDAKGQKGKDGHIAVNAQAAKQATAKLKPAATTTSKTMAVVFMA